jgi:2-oxoglutarate ferredoxin oxidoreductase subunit delta
MIRKINKVEIYQSWCKKCGICAAFCPVKAVEMDQGGILRIINSEQCKGCRLCELRCPDFAIRIKPEEEKTKKAGSTVKSSNSAHSKPGDFQDNRQLLHG